MISPGRKRRVKCDETKPECLRCQNFGCACDGYEFPSYKASQLVPRRLLVPKVSGAVQICPQKSSNSAWSDQTFSGRQGGPGHQSLIIRDGGPNTFLDQSLIKIPSGQVYPNITADNLVSPTIIHSPSMTIFESEQEVQYFRFYCSNTAHQLSGVSTLREWYRESVDLFSNRALATAHGLMHFSRHATRNHLCVVQ